jgi:hypothetical protein
MLHILTSILKRGRLLPSDGRALSIEQLVTLMVAAKQLHLSGMVAQHGLVGTPRTSNAQLLGRSRSRVRRF